MKKLIIPIVIVFAIVASFILNATIFSKANAEINLNPNFNIRVMKTGGASPQSSAEVVYKQGGTTVESGTTDGNGWCYKTLSSGTYDVYVYYPAQPNDGQAGTLLGYYHNTNDDITIVLGPNY